MTQQEQQERAELLLGNLLRIGVVLSFATVVLGVLMLFVRHPEYASNPGLRADLVSSDAIFPRTTSELLTGLLAGEGRAVILLGVLILIFTPILRVVASAVIFTLQKDRIYTVLTCSVLLVLLISFLLGKAEV